MKGFVQFRKRKYCVCVCVCVYVLCKQKIIFTTEVLAEKVSSEAHFGERPPVRLFLMASAEENIRNCRPLWSATIKEGKQCTQFEFVLFESADERGCPGTTAQS